MMNKGIIRAWVITIITSAIVWVVTGAIGWSLYRDYPEFVGYKDEFVGYGYSIKPFLNQRFFDFVLTSLSKIAVGVYLFRMGMTFIQITRSVVKAAGEVNKSQKAYNKSEEEEKGNG